MSYGRPSRAGRGGGNGADCPAGGAGARGGVGHPARHVLRSTAAKRELCGKKLCEKKMLQLVLTRISLVL
jgi:hypothetical protein